MSARLSLSQRIERVFDNHFDPVHRTIFLSSVHVDAEGHESGLDSALFDVCLRGLHILAWRPSQAALRLALGAARQFLVPRGQSHSRSEFTFRDAAGRRQTARLCRLSE